MFQVQNNFLQTHKKRSSDLEQHKTQGKHNLKVDLSIPYKSFHPVYPYFSHQHSPSPNISRSNACPHKGTSHPWISLGATRIKQVYSWELPADFQPATEMRSSGTPGPWRDWVDLEEEESQEALTTDSSGGN